MYSTLPLLSVNLFLDLSWTKSATHFALYFFICLHCLLLLSIILRRVYLVILKKFKINEFTVMGDELTPFDQRLNRTHANLYENVPLWAGLLLLAITSGKHQITDGLAMYFCLARLAQVITHLTSTSERAVEIRSLFFGIQVLIVCIWIIQFGQQWFT